MFDGIRQEDTKHSFVKFYLPKLAILGLFWISLIVGFTLYALYEVNDPSAVVELQGYVLFFSSSHVNSTSGIHILVRIPRL